MCLQCGAWQNRLSLREKVSRSPCADRNVSALHSEHAHSSRDVLNLHSERHDTSQQNCSLRIPCFRNSNYLLDLHTPIPITLLLLVPTTTLTLLRQKPFPYMWLRKQQVNLLQTLTSSLRTKEPHKRHSNPVGRQHPKPYLPANVFQRNASGKHGQEAEEPLAKSTGCTTDVAVLERCDLEQSVGQAESARRKKEVRHLPRVHTATVHQSSRIQKPYSTSKSQLQRPTAC